METTRDQREDHTRTSLPTTEVIAESEGPKETDRITNSNESNIPGFAIYMLADKAIIEADVQIKEIYYPGTSMNEIIESLYKIKSLLDVIKREARRLYDETRDKNC